MNHSSKFRSKRPLPFFMLIAAAAVGICLSLPISGLGLKEKHDNLLPPESYIPLPVADERDKQLLKEEVEKERHKAGMYQVELQSEKEYSQFLLGEVQKYKILSGLTPMRGPGIIITLSESREPTPTDWEPEALLIHHEDLLKVINELWQNKAEAVAIGSGRYMERITTFSPVSCSGGAIIVNDQRMVPPYQIMAIGDPELLRSVLEIRGGYLEKLKAFNINVDIKTSNAVEIPAYSGTTLSLYSHAILGDEELKPPADEGEDE